MRRVSDWLYRCSNAWTIAGSLLLAGLFVSQVMVPESETVRAYAGDWGSPDGHLFYAPARLYAEIARWGPTGRAHYADFRLGLDPVWAFVYAAYLVTLTSTALRSAVDAGDRRRLLNLGPLVPMLADLAENGLGIALVSAYPARLDPVAWGMTAISAVKWTTLGLAHVVMAGALIAALRSRLRGDGGGARRRSDG